MPVQIAAALLVAGQSRRMGAPKPLVSFEGEALVRHAARALAGAGYAPLLVVLPPGERGEAIAAQLSEWPFFPVWNPQPERGLLSSFQAAVRALEAEPAWPGPDALVFALADMPLVSVQTHRALQEAFAARQPPAVQVLYGQVPAPPLLLRADQWAGLLALPADDHGPRALLRQLPETERLPRPAAELLDIDTPAELRAASSVSRPSH